MCQQRSHNLREVILKNNRGGIPKMAHVSTSNSSDPFIYCLYPACSEPIYFTRLLESFLQHHCAPQPCPWYYMRELPRKKHEEITSFTPTHSFLPLHSISESCMMGPNPKATPLLYVFGIFISPLR